jgi:folate-binding protein YgfZ
MDVHHRQILSYESPGTLTGDDNSRMNNSLHGMAKLSTLGVIRAQGEDAVSFLQGQLTQDFALLDASHARLAGYCTAKGRMLASFIGIKREPTEILLICSRDILAATLKRLSMFVLRAKVKLSDASDEFLLRGLAGDAASSLIDATLPAWTRIELGAASVVQLYPALGQPRVLWIAPVGEAEPKAAEITTELWQWSEVRSGITTLTQPIVEAFVPQMLNYESVGGVSFKKGCYPGQEVVARSQFRGTLKRRTYLVHSEVPVTAGDEVFHSSDNEQPCGTVAQAAPAPTGGFDALASMQTTAADSGTLRLSNGAALQLLELPYPLLAEI